MSTKRRRRTQHTGRITSEAIAAYRANDARSLHSALRLPPWQVSPVRAVGACPWPAHTAGYATWGESIALRAELEAMR